MFSRREFFGRIARAAEDPQRWREKRVAELRELALKSAPSDWTSAQREEAARAVEQKLSYLGDAALRQPNIRKYVEQIVRTKQMFYEARRAEEEYLRSREQTEYPDYTSEYTEETQ